MSKYLDPNFTIRENKRLIGYTNDPDKPKKLPLIPYTKLFVSYQAVTNNSGKVESLDDFTSQKVYPNNKI